MEILIDLVNKNIELLVIAFGSFTLVSFVLVIASIMNLKKQKSRLNRLTRGMDNKDLENILNLYLDKVERTEAKIAEFERIIGDLQKDFKNCVQKVALIRYNAFEDMGSDLSFSAALLNANGDGIVITGISGRNDSRIYSKPVKGGNSTYNLSDEEREAIKRALKKE
jgi:uncharacterized protein YlxW (UPF0749 family)